MQTARQACTDRFSFPTRHDRNDSFQSSFLILRKVLMRYLAD
jgi:hypothetical protein